MLTAPSGVPQICKYFLDAVEKSQYGWFWECPNGSTCHYRHALPPGFVLKKDRVKEKASTEEFSLEDWIETERGKLDHSKLTPVTKESFEAWKIARIAKRTSEEKKSRDQKEASVRAGRMAGLSGRDLFSFRPDLFVDDDDAADDDVYADRASDDEGETDAALASAADALADVDLGDLPSDEE